MIVIGYQGVGKSTLAKMASNVIDLESGNFWIGNKRHDDWFIPYCKIALHLSEQGNVVFISSHKVVRDYLRSLPKTELIVVCYPSLNLEHNWVQKLKTRYIATGLDKDYKAFKSAEQNYIYDIQNLMAEDTFTHICISDMEYDLKNCINDLKNKDRKIL